MNFKGLSRLEDFANRTCNVKERKKREKERGGRKKKKEEEGGGVIRTRVMKERKAEYEQERR